MNKGLLSGNLKRYRGYIVIGGIMVENITGQKLRLFDENWQNLLVAIYQQAVEDMALKPDRNPDFITAKLFIKNNPFGLECDFDKLIEFTKQKYDKDRRRLKDI